jgi:hypothetical protein
MHPDYFYERLESISIFTEECHKMSHRGGGSKISQKSVTYNLNGV